MSEASENGKSAELISNGSIALSLVVEASETMAGQKWERLANIISHFLRNLGSRDLVSCITFNSKIEILAKSSRNLIKKLKNREIR